MAEPIGSHTSAEVLVFEFICPGCRATIAVLGRVVLTTELRVDDVACPDCERVFRLARRPPTAD